MKVVRSLNVPGHVSGQRSAMLAVRNAIAHGMLAKPSTLNCVDCGKHAEVYDHRDYNKPLSVEPVCRSCNSKRGPAVPLSFVDSFQVEKTEMPTDLPSTVSKEIVDSCPTYRQAVCLAWELRKSRGMTQATLAEMIGAYAQHVSDYLSTSAVNRNGTERRELLARMIPAFERAVGNTLVSQWIAHQSGLVVLQGLIAEQKAA